MSSIQDNIYIYYLSASYLYGYPLTSFLYHFDFTSLFNQIVLCFKRNASSKSNLYGVRSWVDKPWKNWVLTKAWKSNSIKSEPITLTILTYSRLVKYQLHLKRLSKAKRMTESFSLKTPQSLFLKYISDNENYWHLKFPRAGTPTTTVVCSVGFLMSP